MKDPGIPNVQAPLSFCGPYVISHRFIYQVIGGLKGCHTLSYRPPGEHHHIGSYDTAGAAMAAARQHAKGLKR